MSKELTDLTFTINHRPVPKSRVRFTKSGHAYTPTKTRNYENVVGFTAKSAMKGVSANQRDDLFVRANFYVNPTTRRGDLDNYVKSLLDGMNGVAFRDDQQIVRIEARITRKTDRERTEVQVGVESAAERVQCAECRIDLDWDKAAAGYKFCSVQCHDANQRQGVTRACAGCGEPVWRSNEKSSARQSWCSPECRKKARATCRQCGKSINRAPASKNRTCSAECAEAWHRDNPPTNGKNRLYSCRTCGGPCTREGAECRACWVRGLREYDPDERVECPGCGSKMKAVSLPVHKRRFSH